eukprot:14249-Heterococcus_DN1.PRE.8
MPSTGNTCLLQWLANSGHLCLEWFVRRHVFRWSQANSQAILTSYHECPELPHDCVQSSVSKDCCANHKNVRRTQCPGFLALSALCAPCARQLPLFMALLCLFATAIHHDTLQHCSVVAQCVGADSDAVDVCSTLCSSTTCQGNGGLGGSMGGMPGMGGGDAPAGANQWEEEGDSDDDDLPDLEDAPQTELGN